MGGGGSLLRPTPFYSRLLDRYLKTSWTVFLHPQKFVSWCPSMRFSASNEFLLFFKAYPGRWLSNWKKISVVRLGSFYRRKSFQAYAQCTLIGWCSLWSRVKNRSIYVQKRGQCFLFSVVFIPSPPSLSLLLNNTVGLHCRTIYDWRGFVGPKTKTSVGLLVFNPFCQKHPFYKSFRVV